jgi:acyl-CoA synthetase (AMP-forming)/AMP-acid ligase II
LHLGSVGNLAPGYNIKLVDENGKGILFDTLPLYIMLDSRTALNLLCIELGCNEIGELCMQGPTVMSVSMVQIVEKRVTGYDGTKSSI